MIDKHVCPRGCGQDRVHGALAQDTVRCGACGALIPSPQAQMFAKEQRVSILEFLKRRAACSQQSTLC